ncbi:MAG: ProQ/FinO family protein [Rhodocyclaceae bacterium]
MADVPSSSATSLLKELRTEFKAIGEFLPLAIGIDKQLLEVRPDIDRKKLRAALGMHTRSFRYMKSLQDGTQRFNLNGEPAGEVSEEQRALASKELAQRLQKVKEERKAAALAKKAAEKSERVERERTEKLNQLVSKFSRK